MKIRSRHKLMLKDKYRHHVYGGGHKLQKGRLYWCSLIKDGVVLWQGDVRA